MESRSKSWEQKNQLESYYRNPEDDVCIKVVAVEVEIDRLWKCFGGVGLI